METPILAYHRIVKDCQPMDRGRLAIPVAQFGRQMRYLHEQGYSCLPLIDLIKPLKHVSSRLKKGFVLTFDDGYLDFLMEAYPILSLYEFTATVFLVTDRVGMNSNWGTALGIPLMNWEQIRELSHRGISFGSHTCTHPQLSQLPDEQIRIELMRSKEKLEMMLSKDIRLFAYPFGITDERIQRMAMEAGYEAACGVNRGKRGPLNLRRCPCYADESLSNFAFKLTRWYRSIEYLREDTVFGQFLRWIKH
jgi:peptidoglycan/xylan/chitin deacetylase (PgdA/CDA1 family)